MEDITINPRKAFGLGLVGVLIVASLVSVGKIVENVDANETVVIQAVGTGTLRWYTSPGWKWQLFGTVTSYPKRDIYRFNFPVRFNDGGHGTMWGSIQYDFPTDPNNLTALHTKFRGRDAVQQQLVQTVTNKSVYMTGPLMSSRESYAERRNDLIRFVEDQVERGVYRTRTKEQKMADPITGAEKSVQVVEIVAGQGGPERQEAPVLAGFGIRTFNFAIDSLPYDEAVEKQIQQQQQLAMQVQTSIAEARQSEQRAITAQKNGEAAAAEARWKQEAVRAESVTVAQRRLDVARLDAQAAGQFKLAETLRGEGTAARRRLEMQADGALDKKLEALVRINQTYAENFSKYTGAWVPNVVMGGEGSTRPASGAMDLMNLLTIQTARQLGLDLGVQTRGKTQQPNQP